MEKELNNNYKKESLDSVDITVSEVNTKAEVINYVKDCGAEDCIIIGDRKFDISGAKECGIDSIGITFGYGTTEEITEHNPTYICNSIEEIRKILL